MTEIGIPCWTDHREALQVGSCGRVDEENFELAVLDVCDRPVPAGQVGEFAVRPRHPWTTMQGYLGMPEQTVQAWRNLWFHTGDCGYVDQSGAVYFVDRAKERIRRRARIFRPVISRPPPCCIRTSSNRLRSVWILASRATMIYCFASSPGRASAWITWRCCAF